MEVKEKVEIIGKTALLKFLNLGIIKSQNSLEGRKGKYSTSQITSQKVRLSHDNTVSSIFFSASQFNK